MAFYTMKSGKAPKSYGVNEYVCDTKDDIEKLPRWPSPGSMALTVDKGEVYILNPDHEWKLLDGGSGEGGESDCDCKEDIEDLKNRVEQLETLPAELNALLDGAPEEFDTLKEVADCIDNNQETIDSILTLAKVAKTGSYFDLVDIPEHGEWDELTE